jgi:cell division protein FtsB
MTITTPPQETRTRRPRRTGDDAAPSRPARRRTPPPEERDETVESGAVKTRPARPAKSATRTAPKTTERRRPAAPRKPPPKAAPARRSATPPRAPFVLLVCGLLGGALVSLLLLNTVLAQDAFTLSELQRGNQQLSERKQALQEDINRENSPAVLHSKARNLGMVDGQRPAFIDPHTGRVTEGGARPPGVSDEAMAAAAGAGVTGAPGPIMPPAGGGAPRGARTGGGTR